MIAINKYEAALEWFKEKSGIDFFKLADDSEERRNFYRKSHSIKNSDDEEVQSIYRHTIC